MKTIYGAMCYGVTYEEKADVGELFVGDDKNVDCAFDTQDEAFDFIKSVKPTALGEPELCSSEILSDELDEDGLIRIIKARINYKDGIAPRIFENAWYVIPIEYHN